MSGSDRVWIAVCAIGALCISRVRVEPWASVAEIVWFGLLLVMSMLDSKRHSAAVADPPREVAATVPAVAELPPVAAVRAQLEAYALAGFTDAEAQGLVQEQLRLAVRASGGWKP